MINFISKTRNSLIGAWVASCVIGWFTRWLILLFTGTTDIVDNATLIGTYSIIDTISRMVQGAVFFLIIHTRHVCEAFIEFNKELKI